MATIEVKYKGDSVGALSYEKGETAARFEYFPEFVEKEIPLAPLMMPLEERRIYRFPELNWDTFKGLPGMLADSMPDDFGNAVLNRWIAQQPSRNSKLTPLERLQYTGSRGMGALEYFPSQKHRQFPKDKDIYLEALTRLAQTVLDSRNNFAQRVEFNAEDQNDEMMEALLAVGTSAGGARPKAVLAFNEDFTEVRSGQGDVAPGFSHYLLKFDGVQEKEATQQTFGDPLGYGVMEYVYHLMAIEAKIDMMPCRLLNDGSRRHFITQRFDRIGNEKKHVQTLAAINHVNYQAVGSFSYGELFIVARELRLPKHDALNLFRRMVFNHVATNHDDHSKNFAFMLEGGRWRLSPAYDVVFSFRPGSPWVEKHWMSLNGKRVGHTREDFYALARVHLPLIEKSEIDMIIDEVIHAVSKWEVLAKEHEVPATLIKLIQDNIRYSEF